MVLWETRRHSTLRGIPSNTRIAFGRAPDRISVHSSLAPHDSAVAISASFQSSGKFLADRIALQTMHFYAFGPFRLDSEKRVLVRDGQPVALAPKTLEILVLLVEKAGHLVDKDELINRVWPDAFVEEGNLTRTFFSCARRSENGTAAENM